MSDSDHTSLRTSRETAVLLMAFGGPETLEQVGPFMARLIGRQPAPQVVERVAERYRVIGGGSPLPGIVRAQAQALEQELARDGAPVVRAAFKYADPSISSAVRELAKNGCKRVIGISLSPQRARVTSSAYADELLAAGKENGVETVQGNDYYAEPHFVDGIADLTKQALSSFSSPKDVTIVFSAHSLPVEHVEDGDPYVEQLQATIAGVLQRIPSHDWRLAFQSRGMGAGKWLEPQVEDVLQELAAKGRSRVLLVPIGFTCDHVETLYDIDVAIAGRARELGLEFVRAGALNASKSFIEALAAVARPHLIVSEERAAS
ncbi:MAG: ferrochelatase [Chloroflexi bacterium]|nr:ferrochelatase [Chloroflexota bacterium]